MGAIRGVGSSQKSQKKPALSVARSCSACCAKTGYILSLLSPLCRTPPAEPGQQRLDPAPLVRRRAVKSLLGTAVGEVQPLCGWRKSNQQALGLQASLWRRAVYGDMHLPWYV